MIFRGVGALVLKGEAILEPVENVVEYQPSQQGRMGRIDGRLVGLTPIDGIRLMTTKGISDPNTDLALRMDDGRSWYCNLLNNDGLLNNRGGFEPEL